MDDEDVRPLLNDNGNPNDSLSGSKSRLFSWNKTNRNKKDSSLIADTADIFHSIVEENELEPDLVAAVYVVAFDTHSGIF